MLWKRVKHIEERKLKGEVDRGTLSREKQVGFSRSLKKDKTLTAN